MSWFHAARARARLAFQNDDAETRMNEEIALHVDMEAERLQRDEGLAPAEARRRAVLAFGAVEAHKEELRHSRGLAWLGGLKLDLKLGARMLVKYPGLTIVGGLAMAFAIWVGAISFVMTGQVMSPTLPLPGGDRVVRLINWDVEAYDTEEKSLSDFMLWRESLRSVTDLGIYTNTTHNLIVDRDAQLVSVAAITASGFDVASVAPLHGRVLEPSDERHDAPPVVVIGHDVWKDRFASDPSVVGRMVQLDDTHATIVGVMPEGFGFPVDHDAWTPLRLDAAPPEPRSGPDIEIFGRLAAGATLETAQAEIAQLGARAAAERPATHQHLEPHVVGYTEDFPGEALWIMNLVRAFGILLLVLIGSNLALLMFARAAARESELVVRSALGASRSRILVQLFAEALVLGIAAAIVGLGAAQVALRVWGTEFLRQNIDPFPFWLDIRLTPAAILYAAGLTLLGAAIAGVLPARKITRGLGSSLRQGSAGGGGVRFGGVWTAVIVTQVAVTVAFPALVWALNGETVRVASYDEGFESDQYLGVALATDADPDSAGRFPRFASTLEALRARVAAEPGVAGVSYVTAFPRDYHRAGMIELVDFGAAPVRPEDPEVAIAYVEPSYFQVLGAPVLEGRAFSPADAGGGARVVIVDEEFVARMLRGQNAIGRHIRFFEPDEPANDTTPWFEIVGVVPRLGMEHSANRDRGAGVYRPLALAAESDMNLIVHAPGDPLALSTRIRELAVEVDPTLRVTAIQRLDQVTAGMLWVMRLWLNIMIALTGVALLLSLAGIYAVMSFTVVRRTREIGVRVALGGTPRRIVASIFRRPFTQVATGIAIGFVLVTTAAYQIAGRRPDGQPRVEEEMLTMGDVGLIAGFALVMLAVCLLACVVPTLRVLRVQPTEALRVE